MKNFIGFLKGFGVCILTIYALIGMACIYNDCSPKEYADEHYKLK